MNVLIFGDIHGYTGTRDIPTIDVVKDIVNRMDADVILQVGDMGGYRDFSKPVHWIYGNRDSLSLMDANRRGESPYRNLINIGTGEVVTFSLGDEKINVSGLNGAYDPLYFDFKRENLDDLGYFTQSDIERCLTLRNIDIFLAHGSPSGLGLGREPDHAIPAIRMILEQVKPRYMFCGHGHVYREAEYNGSMVYALDEANRAYYLLDTRSGELSVEKIDPSDFG
jgi:predicted phosphodiesterase